LGDPSCSIAWSTKLAASHGVNAVTKVLRGADPENATGREIALRGWAAKIVDDPNAIEAADVEKLRTAGLSDREILEATVHVAFRLAFSTVNDALGALPDHQLVDAAPAEIRAAVSYGRPAAQQAIAARKP
jgi:alkylhydroperoxidase family enzyme